MLSNDIKYALSPSLWISEILGFEPDNKQSQILDSNHKRIIINCHRQWGKSTISSLICLHRALFYPNSLCLIIAPALRQSGENFRKVIGFLDSLDQRPELTEDTKLSLTLANDSRILCLPGGNEGITIRGFSGPAIIIEDESARCSDELYQAIRPMMASNPDSRLVLASTPWGQRGHFYKTWTEEDGWLKVKVIVDENPRINKDFLEEEKRALGPFIFQQEYEGEFVASETQLIDFEMIRKSLNADIPIINFGT